MLLTALITAAIQPWAQAAESVHDRRGDSDTESRWVTPQGLPEGHNGGTLERLVAPAAPTRPHIMLILFEYAGISGSHCFLGGPCWADFIG